MSNYLPKGREVMSKLGQLGGRKSGDARRGNAYTLRFFRSVIFGEQCPLYPTDTPVDLMERAERMSRIDRRGGSHDEDWRCPNPKCKHFNSAKRTAFCAKCGSSDLNGRVTRAELRERATEHKYDAILGRFGLTEDRTAPQPSERSESPTPSSAPSASAQTVR